MFMLTMFNDKYFEKLSNGATRYYFEDDMMLVHIDLKDGAIVDGSFKNDSAPALKLKALVEKHYK